MGNTLEEEIIRRRVPIPINYLNYTILFIFIFSILIIILYNYKEYYEDTGIMIEIDNNYYLRIQAFIKDLDFIEKNKIIEIDGKKYNYNYYYLDSKVYVDSKKQNYRYLYLDLNPSNYERANDVLNFKIIKKSQRIIEYFIDYWKRRYDERNYSL